MKMRKKCSIVLVGMLIVSMFAGCAPKTPQSEEQTAKMQTPVEQTSPEQKGRRTITDLSGKQVEIPAAGDIHKVIIVSPPLAATYLNVVKDPSKLIGLHPGCIRNMNPDLLPMVLPNWESINTKFLKGFTSNTEEVLQMAPDIILIYGDFQREGLENVEIPVVDFFMKDTQNEVWSVKIDELMREIFEAPKDDSLQSEWDAANKIVSEALDKVPEDQRKKAIMINTNNKELFSVRGGNYYGDDWLKKTGLQNLAAEMQGDSAPVTMEQIYAWNPDVVYDFGGSDADFYLSGGIDGQDWSLTKAFQEKEIYDMPKGMFNWGAPNADSPLTLIWMTMKNYPGTIEEDFFRQYMKEFYKRRYRIELGDEQMISILDPKK